LYLLGLFDGFDTSPFMGWGPLATIASVGKGQPVQARLAILGIAAASMFGAFDKSKRLGFA